MRQDSKPPSRSPFADPSLRRWLIGTAAAATIVAVAVPVILDRAPDAPTPVSIIGARSNARSTPADPNALHPRSPNPTQRESRDSDADRRGPERNASRPDVSLALPAQRSNDAAMRAFDTLLQEIARKTEDETLTDADFDRLVAALDDPAIAARVAAMLEDRKIPLGALRAHLMRAGLVSKNEIVLRVIRKGTRRLEPLPKDEHALMAILSAANPANLARDVRRVPAEALRFPAVRERVRALALDPTATPATRAGAMDAFARARRPEALDVLRRGFESANDVVRRCAVRSLGRLSPSESTRRLFAAAIAGTDVVTARHAVNGLRADRSSTANRLLLAALSTDDPVARASAVDTLAARRSNATIDAALRTALRNERDPRVRKRLLRALR